MDLRGIEAVTFDFFNTLVFHREGHGRGQAVTHYLKAQGLECAPWRHEVLYEIFANHRSEYSPEAPPEERYEYYLALARRLFEKLRVTVPDRDVARHAAQVWQLLGPACFDMYPDVLPTVKALRSAGYRLAVISNWPSGLGHFCTKLGLSEHFDQVLASGDVGVAKPDTRIFAEACTRLEVHPRRVLHVGDSLTEDYMGAESSGLSAVLIARNTEPEQRAERVIQSLSDLIRNL